MEQKRKTLRPHRKNNWWLQALDDWEQIKKPIQTIDNLWILVVISHLHGKTMCLLKADCLTAAPHLLMIFVNQHDSLLADPFQKGSKNRSESSWILHGRPLFIYTCQTCQANFSWAWELTLIFWGATNWIARQTGLWMHLDPWERVGRHWGEGSRIERWVFSFFWEHDSWLFWKTDTFLENMNFENYSLNSLQKNLQQLAAQSFNIQISSQMKTQKQVVCWKFLLLRWFVNPTTWHLGLLQGILFDDQINTEVTLCWCV